MSKVPEITLLLMDLCGFVLVLFLLGQLGLL